MDLTSSRVAKGMDNSETSGWKSTESRKKIAKTMDGQPIAIIYFRAGDFDAFDLRIGLPAEVSKLYKAINHNGGVTYIH